VAIKKQGVKLILFLPGLLSVFIIFIGVVSINVGIDNAHEEGYMVPILSGLALIIFALALFYYFARFLVSKTKEKGIINNL